jgi:uncharacterized surface protein with fasciclin (FAS1) repeats
MGKKLYISIALLFMLAACSSTPEAAATEAPPVPTAAPLPTKVPPEDYPEGSIAAVLRDDGRFSIFLEFSADVQIHTDVPRLQNFERKWTVFAPTDEAFAALPAELMELMRSDPEAAEEMFFHHHFDRELVSKDFELLATWPTAFTPRTVAIEATDDGFLYDGVLILETDIEAANGVIHVLKAVARPEILTD